MEHKKESNHQTNLESAINHHQPSNCKEALIRLLPRDPSSLIASIGVLAGIGDYIYSHNPWLLLTFIGILFGKSIVEHISPPR